jgi:hypothetical protein
MAFNAPTREVCTVRRAVSNTPLQALVALNDPVFVEAAQGFAGRILREGGVATRQRANWAWRQATGREGEVREIDSIVRLYESAVVEYARDEKSAREMAGAEAAIDALRVSVAQWAAWTVVANMLLNLDSVLTKG